MSKNGDQIDPSKDNTLINAVRTCQQTLLHKKIEQLKESLDALQLAVKYMQFDLEATRRERNYYMDKLRKKEEGE